MFKLARVLLSSAALVACTASSRVPSATPPSFVTTVDGQVLGVDGVPAERRLAENLRVTLRSGADPVVVELAPGWYLEQKGLRFEREQSVAVEGTVDPGRNVLVARRVRANSISVELRDAEGNALWPSMAADGGVTPLPSTAP